METGPEERLAPVLALLADHGIGPCDYVVIGGTAAQLAGWGGRTFRFTSFLTDAGRVDVVLDADGVGGYEDWASGSVPGEVDGFRFLGGGLDDVVT